jgi:hypothetical protein
MRAGGLQRIARAAGIALLSLALFELALRVAVGQRWLRLPAPPPRSVTDFWDGSDPRFGVWHRPNAEYAHTSECFSASYRSNSVGARDRERPLESAEFRVVVLGDSFIEGWGLADGERLSDRLEAAIGVPHLNFGMAHHGPYQSALLYRDLALRYAHDAVLVGLLPANDLADLDYELALRSPSYAYVYRPYLIGTYPNYRELFYREPHVSGWLRRHFFAANAVVFAERRVASWLGHEGGRRVQTPPGHTRSLQFEFRDADFERLRFSLEEIERAASGRRIALLLIPTLADFERVAESGPSPLAARVAAFASEHGMAFVDLLPPLAARDVDPSAYYFEPCDYHWNAAANLLAAEIALDALSHGHFYADRRRATP